jgi:hypothetical protein
MDAVRTGRCHLGDRWTRRELAGVILILTRAREDWRAHHAVAEDIMTTTPRLWKSQTQVNTTDAAFPGRDGTSLQLDGQITPAPYARQRGGDICFGWFC